VFHFANVNLETVLIIEFIEEFSVLFVFFIFVKDFNESTKIPCVVHI